jgi:hypothetical protein
MISRLKGVARAYRDRIACNAWTPMSMFNPSKGHEYLLHSSVGCFVAEYDEEVALVCSHNAIGEWVEMTIPECKEKFDEFMMVPKLESRLLRRWKI